MVLLMSIMWSVMWWTWRRWTPMRVCCVFQCIHTCGLLLMCFYRHSRYSCINSRTGDNWNTSILTQITIHRNIFINSICMFIKSTVYIVLLIALRLFISSHGTLWNCFLKLKLETINAAWLILFSVHDDFFQDRKIVVLLTVFFIPLMSFSKCSIYTCP